MKKKSFYQMVWPSGKFLFRSGVQLSENKTANHWKTKYLCLVFEWLSKPRLLIIKKKNIFEFKQSSLVGLLKTLSEIGWSFIIRKLDQNVSQK